MNIVRLFVWFGRAIAAVAGAILLLQLDQGFFGWYANFLIVIWLCLGAFLAGWFDRWPDE